MNVDETIQISGLSTGYRHRGGAVTVTSALTASLACGELTCLLGPNGAGKSTLLRTLSGTLHPLEGKINVLGTPLDDYNEGMRAKTIGIVLTDRLNLPNSTVTEVIGLGRAPHTGFFGRLSARDDEMVDKAMAMVGIKPLARRKVDSLSDGERQKVMIAKVLAQQTPIILLDEPTAFLDYPSKVELMRLLRVIARENRKTVLLSTHDLELALAMADKLWLMGSDGRIVTGPPAQLALGGEVKRCFGEMIACAPEATPGVVTLVNDSSAQIAIRFK